MLNKFFFAFSKIVFSVSLDFNQLQTKSAGFVELHLCLRIKRTTTPVLKKCGETYYCGRVLFIKIVFASTTAKWVVSKGNSLKQLEPIFVKQRSN